MRRFTPSLSTSLISIQRVISSKVRKQLRQTSSPRTVEQCPVQGVWEEISANKDDVRLFCMRVIIPAPYFSGSVNRLTSLRTRGAMKNSEGKAIGQAVAKPFNHWWGSSGVKPWFMITTAPEMIVTMMLDTMPVNNRLLYLTGIFMNNLYELYISRASFQLQCG